LGWEMNREEKFEVAATRTQKILNGVSDKKKTAQNKSNGETTTSQGKRWLGGGAFKGKKLEGGGKSFEKGGQGWVEAPIGKNTKTRFAFGTRNRGNYAPEIGKVTKIEKCRSFGKNRG